VIALLSASFFVSGCYKAEPTNTLVIGTEKSVSTLDPRFAIDTYSIRATRLIHASLFRINNSLTVEGLLAEKHTVSKDGKIYSIWLKPGVVFHDGKPLTLRDVVATLRFILKAENKSAYRNSLSSIASMVIKSESELEITLNERNTTFLSALVIGILPERFETTVYEPIGAGPYKVAENLGKDGLKLVRFDNYLEGAPQVTRLFLKPVLDDGVRLLELMKGSVDLVQNAISPTLLQRAKSNKDVHVTTSDGLAYAYIGMNLNDDTLKNIAVRRAIAHAVNRPEIIKYKLKDLAAPANSILSPSHYLYNSAIDQISFDPTLAKKLLDDAGFKDPDGDGPKARFNLTFKTSTNPERVEIAQVIVDQLKAVGIGAELRSLEFGAFFDDVKKGNFQLYSLEWSGVFSEDIFYYVFHSDSLPPNGANRGHYTNAEVDRLAAAGRVTPEGPARQQIYKRLQEIIHDELPYVSLWYRKNLVAHRSRLTGYQVNTVADYSGIRLSELKE
jgi:peptide/nickel transport system substrate-binding protein